MRELRVEDALMYLDQVKMEFGDRPHIYNEFLDIMKTFKSQQIDTPGVIRRVSALFHGNKKLVLGFNTFLPEGYKIELHEGTGPVAVYRAPNSNDVTQILGPGMDNPPSSSTTPQVPPPASTSSSNAPPPKQREMMEDVKPPLLDQQQQQQQQLPPQSHSQAPQLSPPFKKHQSMPKMPTNSAPSVMGQAPSHTPAHPPEEAFPPQPHHHLQQQQQQQPHLPVIPANNPLKMSGRAPPPINEMEKPFPPAPELPPKEEPSHHPHQPPLPPPSHTQAPPPPPVMEKPKKPAQSAPPPPPSQQQQQQQPPSPNSNSQQQPVEFDHAINYVTTIKKRFANEPDTYKAFLDILHTYQKEQRGITEVLEEVSHLFFDHPDLLREFTYFLPDAVQAQAKAQLAEVAKAAEARKRSRLGRPPSSTTSNLNRSNTQRKETATSAAPTEPSKTTTSTPVTQTNNSATTSAAPAPIPFGASQGRSEEREREICRGAIFGVVTFAPVRPPKRHTLTPSQSALKYGRPRNIPELPIQPTVAESAFFERVRQHLTRKELAPDKLPTSRRHTPHAEFMKTLHLYGANIISKDELVLLLRGLFMQGHAPKTGIHAGGGASNPVVAAAAQELMKELEVLLINRGPYADQERQVKNKGKYGCLSIRDYDLSEASGGSSKKHVTPSYFFYPKDFDKYSFLSFSGQTAQDKQVLNSDLICYNPKAVSKGKGGGASSSSGNNISIMHSPEDYDGPKVRRNIYEETMFKIEEERFEVDIAIERNASALRQIEPLAEEATLLKEGEEKDGQPIGRLQYKLRHCSLGSTHISSIARVYGDAGDEVVHHLLSNPIAVLPIIYKRLLAMNTEWRNVRKSLTQHWRKATDINCKGSLDVTCYFYRKEIERSFMYDWLLEEVQRAKHYFKHPRKQPNHPVTICTNPTFYNLNGDDLNQFLFQPHISIGINNSMPHKDAYKLVNMMFHLNQNKSSGTETPEKGKGNSSIIGNLKAAEKEKLSRIWAEFVAPWFDLPIYWFLEELRERSSSNTKFYQRDKSSNIAKYASSQKVRTAYGDGQIQNYFEGSFSHTHSRYKIKFPYGVGYIRPNIIIHALPSDSNSTAFSDSRNLQVMFGTEKIYIFLRLYCHLVLILNDAKQTLQNNLSYHQLLNLLSAYKQKEDMTFKVYEMKCRTISKELVCKFAALPRLLDKCAESMIKIAKEDVFLALHDLSQLGCSDLNLLRSMSVEVTSEATYRIQYLPKRDKLCFMFLNYDIDMVLSPPKSLLKSEMDDRGEEHNDNDRPSKRLKAKY